MWSGEQEKLRLIMAALDYSMKQIAQTRRSLKESLAAGKMTAPLTLLEQSERDLDSLCVQVLKVRNEIELALGAPDNGIAKLKLDGASKDIIAMGLGMYELDLIKIASAPDGGLGTDRSIGTEERLRLINETRRALDL